MKKLSEAILLATQAHDGVFDKAGKPYILHPTRVMLRLMNEDAPEYLLVAAILHDTVEDTNVTLDEIEAQFGSLVRVIVDAVSRRDESYPDFILRVKASGSDAVALKLADIADNTDLRRPRIESLAKRYAAAKEVLTS